ncbi:baseplate J/gp47 family protein [Enterobacteriaceae bacterium ESL0689]|nr:baseplate J/gp47 family protein [Enterobacteriaceae bacterium ESL0689]
MLRITDTGIIIDQLADVHQRLIEGFRRIYGDDINLDSDTPDGQMIGLFSQEIANVNQAIAMIVQMLDPYKATGTWLEQRSMYAGVVRRGADYSYIHDVVFTGRPNIPIPAGAVLVDSNRVKWLTLTAISLNTNGSARAGIRSVELGGYSLSSGSELTMETVTVGVEKVTTTSAAIPGAFEETDGNLLIRFMRSHSINNHDDRQGLEGHFLILRM